MGAVRMKTKSFWVFSETKTWETLMNLDKNEQKQQRTTSNIPKSRSGAILPKKQDVCFFFQKQIKRSQCGHSVKVQKSRKWFCVMLLTNFSKV